MEVKRKTVTDGDRNVGRYFAASDNNGHGWVSSFFQDAEEEVVARSVHASTGRRWKSMAQPPPQPPIPDAH